MKLKKGTVTAHSLLQHFTSHLGKKERKFHFFVFSFIVDAINGRDDQSFLSLFPHFTEEKNLGGIIFHSLSGKVE